MNLFIHGRHAQIYHTEENSKFMNSGRSPLTIYNSNSEVNKYFLLLVIFYNSNHSVNLIMEGNFW